MVKKILLLNKYLKVLLSKNSLNFDLNMQDNKEMPIENYFTDFKTGNSSGQTKTYINIPTLPPELMDPNGSHKGTKKKDIDRQGLPYIVLNNGYDRNYGILVDSLPRNHPDILEMAKEFTPTNEYSPELVIVKVPRCLLPYIKIKTRDEMDILSLDIVAMERDIALEEIRKLRNQLELKQ